MRPDAAGLATQSSETRRCHISYDYPEPVSFVLCLPVSRIGEDLVALSCQVPAIKRESDPIQSIHVLAAFYRC